MSAEFVKVIAETIKAIVESIAFGCAGGFFVWKIRSGYQVVNLSLDLQCHRVARAADIDLLVVSVTVTKGDRGSLEVHDVQARFTIRDQVRTAAFAGFERSSFTTESLPAAERHVINWSKPSKSSPFLRLTPGESTSFSCHVEVPKSETCFIEVAVLGKQASGKKVGQWKATHVSVPRA
jgi:hypothetical protein